MIQFDSLFMIHDSLFMIHDSLSMVLHSSQNSCSLSIQCHVLDDSRFVFHVLRSLPENPFMFF